MELYLVILAGTTVGIATDPVVLMLAVMMIAGGFRKWPLWSIPLVAVLHIGFIVALNYSSWVQAGMLDRMLTPTKITFVLLAALIIFGAAYGIGRLLRRIKGAPKPTTA